MIETSYCVFCGKKEEHLELHRCKFCGLPVCSEHILPESHECKKLPPRSFKEPFTEFNYPEQEIPHKDEKQKHKSYKKLIVLSIIISIISISVFFYSSHLSYKESYPIFSNIGRSTTEIGASVVFSVKVQDAKGLSKYIFSFDNGVGKFVNTTAIKLSGKTSWANITITITSTIGATIRYQWFFCNVNGTWGSTPIQSFITIVGGTKVFAREGTFTTLTINNVIYSFWKSSLSELIVGLGTFGTSSKQSFTVTKVGQIFFYKEIQITITEIYSDRFVIYVKSID